MNTRFFRHELAGVLALSCLFLLPCSSSAQGPLTPPGAPTPTMKTLDQVESRTPIPGGSIGFVISASGAYVLTGNLSISGGSSSHAITVNASHVTIDLNGFDLAGSGASTSGAGIFISGAVSNVTIHNGTIRNWGVEGINGAGNSKMRVKDLRVFNNGAAGILVDVNGVVVNCIAEFNTGTGIQGTNNCLIKDCQAISTAGSGAIGISLGSAAIVTGCIARDNNGDGIAPGQGSTVKDCLAYNNTRHGISVGDGSTVQDCTLRSNSVYGIRAVNDCKLVQNHCSNNGISVDGGGVYVDGVRTLIDGNNVSNNRPVGINVVSADNIIIRNIAIKNFLNYNGVVSANDFAPMGPAKTSTNPWLNVDDL